jgi:methyl-accepting chemotaxis protein
MEKIEPKLGKEELKQAVTSAKKTYSLAKRISIIMLPVLWVMFTIMIVVNMKVLRPAVKNVYNFNMAEIASARAAQIDSWLSGYLLDLKVYSGSEAVKSGNEDTVVSWLHANTKLRNPDYDYMFFCGPDGSTKRDTGLVGKVNGITDRDYFQAVMKNGKDLFIGNAVVSRTSGKTVVPITRAARDGSGKTFGFFTGMLGIGMMQKEIASIKIGSEGYLFVTDSKGTILAHPDSSLVMTNFNSDTKITQMLRSGRKGTLEVDNAKQGHQIISFAPITAADGWMVGVVVPDHQVQETADKVRNLSLIMEIITGVTLYVLVTFIVMLIISRLNVVRRQLTDIARGDADLTKTIPVKNHDEVGQLAVEFNGFTGKIREIIASIKNSQTTLHEVDGALTEEISRTGKSVGAITGSVSEIGRKIEEQTNSVEQTSGSVEEISKNIESLEQMIQNQSASVTQASASVEEMIGNINSMDTSVSNMAQEFSVLAEDTESGITKNSQVNGQVRKIADESAMLQEANEIITSIAEQTNLLAMNAAIEAAHAGEAGKGFSVVADEIRKLAETSSEQSKRIGDELKSIQETIAAVVNASEDSEKSFDSVSKRITSTDQLVQQIHGAIQEQNEGSKQILAALQTMNDSTQEVKSSSGEMTVGTKTILDEIEKLRDISEEIRALMSKITMGTMEINEASKSLTDASSSMDKSVTEIGSQIDLFKV